jgi:ABC-type branched-subunit amino acid transport system substrate-binding protein
MRLNARFIVIFIVVAILGIIGLSFVPVDEVPEVTLNAPDYNVTLGYIAATQRVLPEDGFLISLAENDINEYCEDNDILWRFHFDIRCAEGQAQNAHDFTGEFAENGVKLVGGYGWSSFLCSGARKIAEENNMTLVSVASTSPLMAIPDSAFRLCHHDLRQVDPILAIFNEFNVTSVIIIQRGDHWGDLIVDELKSKYTSTIVEKIRYPAETTEFAHYLEMAEAAYLGYNGSDKPHVLLISFTEAASLLTQASDFPALFNTTWFGADSIADNRQIREDSGEYAAQVIFYSPKQTVYSNDPDYNIINRLYREKFFEDMDFYKANVYDCCWLMAYCVIDTNTTDGATIQSSILEVASNHTGITGDLSLDENGDRVYAPYSIWGYFEIDGEYVSRECGFYDSQDGKIIWDTALVQ